MVVGAVPISKENLVENAEVVHDTSGIELKGYSSRIRNCFAQNQHMSNCDSVELLDMSELIASNAYGLRE